MWKPVTLGNRVRQGDLVRLTSLHKSISEAGTYVVVNSDMHYFEIMGLDEKTSGVDFDKKYIKYLDIGHHLRLEVWTQPNS